MGTGEFRPHLLRHGQKTCTVLPCGHRSGSLADVFVNVLQFFVEFCECLCVSVYVLYLTQIITLDNSPWLFGAASTPLYSCQFIIIFISIFCVGYK